MAPPEPEGEDPGATDGADPCEVFIGSLPRTLADLPAIEAALRAALAELAGVAEPEVKLRMFTSHLAGCGYAFAWLPSEPATKRVLAAGRQLEFEWATNRGLATLEPARRHRGGGRVPSLLTSASSVVSVTVRSTFDCWPLARHALAWQELLADTGIGLDFALDYRPVKDGRIDLRVGALRCCDLLVLLWRRGDVPCEALPHIAADARELGKSGRRLLLVEAAPPAAEEAPADWQLGAKLMGAEGVEAWSWERLAELYPDASCEGLNFAEPAYGAACALAVRRAVACHLGTSLKVFVCDCDHTLWAGVVSEDGVQSLDMGGSHALLQQRLSQLQRLGKLICLASRNEEEDVLRVFDERAGDMALQRSQLAAWQVHWGSKVGSLRKLSAELNLSLDAFVFLDDNPAEIQEVLRSLPQVLAVHVPSTDAGAMARVLSHHWALDVWAGAPTTAEDARRTEMYRENAARRAARREATSVDAFLQSLALQLDIRPPLETELARVSQLTLRTNQFNTTQLRLSSERSLLEWLDGGRRWLLGVWLRDRFGDYGLVAAALCSEAVDALVAECFTMSCRVLGRGVEHALLRQLAVRAAAAGLPRLLLPVAGTKPNRRVRAFLERVAARLQVPGLDDGPMVSYGLGHRLMAPAVELPCEGLLALESCVEEEEEEEGAPAPAAGHEDAGSDRSCIGEVLALIAGMGATLPADRELLPLTAPALA